MRWKALHDRIRSDIARGVLAPGTRLPTQERLSREYGISRHDVRLALRRLCQRGLIATRQGRGSWVESQGLTHVLSGTHSLDQEAARQGLELVTTTHAVWRARSAGTAASDLGLEPGCALVVAEQLSFLDGRAFQVARYHVRADRLTIGETALDRGIDAAVLLSAFGLGRFSRTKTRVTARLPSATETSLLNVPPSQPVVEMRTGWGDSAERTIAVAVTVARADRIALET